MEGAVRGVLEARFGEALVVVDGAVADELDLGDARDGLEVGVEDGFGGVAGFVVAVAVVLGGGVEGFGEGVLLLGGELGVAEEERRVLQDEYE